jgi:hypothetical protein
MGGGQVGSAMPIAELDQYWIVFRCLRLGVLVLAQQRMALAGLFPTVSPDGARVCSSFLDLVTQHYCFFLFRVRRLLVDVTGDLSLTRRPG